MLQEPDVGRADDLANLHVVVQERAMESRNDLRQNFTAAGQIPPHRSSKSSSQAAVCSAAPAQVRVVVDSYCLVMGLAVTTMYLVA